VGEASPIGSVLGTKPSTMIVHQPDIPAPVLINFPLPAWATRSEEVDDQGLDKTARISQENSSGYWGSCDTGCCCPQPIPQSSFEDT